MEFEPNLKINDIISNQEIMNIFSCSGSGSMRRSLKSNSLVLISNLTTNSYKDIWFDNGVWNFSGMGTEGDQREEYRQNQTLLKSNEDKVDLHLFIVKEKGKFTYKGRVLLAGEPKQEDDNIVQGRKILIFPLLEVGKREGIINFLLDYKKSYLITNSIIDSTRDMLTSKNVFPLLTFMKEKKVDTLFSRAGWFLNKDGYFHNSYSTGKKMGNIHELLEEKQLKLNDIFKNQNKFINPFFKESSVYNAKKSIIPLTSSQTLEPSQLRVVRLVIQDRQIRSSIDFGNYNLKNNRNVNFYTSLLIGPNGTGKSMMLSYTQKIFTDLYRLNLSKPTNITKNINYSLEYLIGKDSFIVKQDKGKISFFKNNSLVSLREMELPFKVISCAFTLQDRFSILNEKDEQLIDQYVYLGIKKYVRKSLIKSFSSVVAENIMLAALKNRQFLRNILSINSYLGFEPQIKIYLKILNDRTLEEINEDSLIRKQQNLPKKLKDSFLVKELLEFVEKLKEKNSIEEELFHLDNNGLSINFNLTKANEYETLYEDFQSVQHLINLKIFESPSIMMKKGIEWFPLEKASSGEFQYFSTMINILSKIEPNSLIILDEPETSLHPTWQHRYMSQLQNIFSEFPSCHFLIATHSHFMVADLLKENSSIITLIKDEEDKVNVNLLDEATFGRSIEDILYDVFNLPTNRNHYLANDLDEILLAISMDGIDDNIRIKVKKLKSVQKYLKDADPLKELIEKISKQVDINV